MRVRVGEAVRTGRAIDLRESDAGAKAVAAAIRGATGDERAVTVDCPDPGPVHEHVGVLRVGVDLSLRPALAATARSRGHVAPEADDLAAVEERLDSLDVPTVDLRRARRRVADASDAETELRERVATLQGRVRALREGTDDAAPAEADLADATRRLSEVQTERIAAEQALARARDRATANRERRRERLRLEDRAGNLRRAARESLADAVREDFEAARDAVPDRKDLGESVEAALAVARVAELDAPVVVSRAVDPFGSAADATRWLDAPVVRT